MRRFTFYTIVFAVLTGGLSCQEAPRARPQTRAAQTPPPLVIPTPKRLTIMGKPFRIDARTRLVVAEDATAQDRLAAESVQHELAAHYGLGLLPIVRFANRDSDVIVFGEPGRVPLVKRLLVKSGAALPTRAEGYALRTGEAWVVVGGHDPAGTFYGAQTLCQLIGKDSRGVYVAAAQVDDWPSLRWRGAHLFCGNRALPFHKKLIGSIFARYKMNALVLQCEQAKWDTLGSAAPPWAMSKADLRREVDFAQKYHMTVTPLIESVGHMEWLLRDPVHRDLAEDPQTPFAANVSNRATDRLLFRLYDEVLDTFHPRSLHIGGDEVTLQGRYPYLSRARYPTVSEAYVAQVTKLHDHLKTKGVGTMLWGDMLLAHGEAFESSAPSPADARRMRAALPKDIVITDWHYAPSGNFASPQLFHAAGFPPVIGATWYEPRDIAGFAQAQVANHQGGLLQTTWAGYNSSADNLRQEKRQFVAFVLAAEYAWSGVATPPDKLPYDPAKIFDASYNAH